MLKRSGIALGLLSLFTAFAAGAAWVWFERTLSPVSTSPNEARTIDFEVEAGDSFWRVTASLEHQGLIRSARVARWFVEAEGLASRLKTGEYALSSHQSTPEIVDALVRGRVETHAVVIPEGLRATDIATRLAEAGLADREAFLAVVFDPDSPGRFGVEGPTLEGYLFPDTYRFARGVPEARIARAMVDQFLRVYAEVRKVSPEPTLSMRAHTTLASIVEKETGAAQERPLIAAVFLNRLKRRMRLETDPTVIYGIPEFDGNLRRVDLENGRNPYNTYKISGLPPGPIASPGREALRAVIQPADSPYLFFVSRNDGTHVFAKTYREHEANVDAFQRRRRRR